MIAERQKIVISDSAANGLSLNNNPIQSSISIDIGKDISGYTPGRSSANRIFIGRKSYKKGFTIEDGWLITIMQDGFLIEKDGEKKTSYP